MYTPTNTVYIAMYHSFLVNDCYHHCFNHYTPKFTVSRKESKIREYIFEEISYLSVIHLQVCHHYPYHQVVLLNLCDIYVGIGPIRHICATKIKSLHLSLQIKLLHLCYQGFMNSRWYSLYKSLPMERLGGHR